jgi:DNA gyrase subunit B
VIPGVPLQRDVKHLNAPKDPLFAKVCQYEEDDADGQMLDIAIQWNTGYHEGIHGYANGISTIEGGMHVEGFRTALTSVVNKYAREKNLLKEKDPNLTGEDIREGLTAIVSVKLREPQFEGQTKAKLGNVPMRSFVQKVTYERMAEWLDENPTEANKVVKKALAAAQARVAAKNARNAIRRKTALSGAGMPDKLKDCSSKNADESELLIVEGGLAARGGPRGLGGDAGARGLHGLVDHGPGLVGVLLQPVGQLLVGGPLHE